MKQELQFFENIIYNEKYFSAEKSEEAVLMLHGYPSPEGKNEYIAEYISSYLKKDVFLIHYAGLGKSNLNFSFPKSIEDSINYFNCLNEIKKYKSFYLIGHSWGGLIALNIIKHVNTNNIKSVLLLSPYTYFPSGCDLTQLIQLVYNETKEFFRGSYAEMANQVQEIILNYQPLLFLDKLKSFTGVINIIQAANDIEVLPSNTKLFFDSLSNRATYFEINCDHGFSQNREDLLLLIHDLIGKS